MSAQIQATDAVNELATLLIPINGKQLVLPNVTVAEIIHFSEPVPEEDQPNWFLGYFNWRDTQIPLVAFESINDEPFVSQGNSRRIAVLNGIIDDPKLPFCGIVTEGVPRLMRVVADEVATDSDANLGPAELSRVLVSGEKATIPNVDYIQGEVVKIIK